MPYCKKCGFEVKEDMTFCPQCGASLKVSDTRATERYRSEKSEKQEKQEKNEKREKSEQQEKYEKQEYGVIAPLIGGLILIFLGFIFYLAVTGVFTLRDIFPIFLVVVGVIVILGVIIAAIKAKGRNPIT